jgi:hypothetical protein
MKLNTLILATALMMTASAQAMEQKELDSLNQKENEKISIPQSIEQGNLEQEIAAFRTQAATLKASQQAKNRKFNCMICALWTCCCPCMTCAWLCNE